MTAQTTDFLDAFTRQDLETLRRFLLAHGVHEDAYSLAPLSQVPGGNVLPSRTITALYRPERFRDGNETAELTWASPAGYSTVRTGLPQAIFAMAFALYRPDNLAVLSQLNADANPHETIRMLGLPKDVLVPRVAAWRAGSFIAPEDSGWTYFLVEDRGEIAIIAEASHATPLLQLYACDRLSEDQNLAGQMAEYRVPLDLTS